MKKILTALAVVALLASGSAFADPKDGDWVPPGHRNVNRGGDDVSNDNSNRNRSSNRNDNSSRSGVRNSGNSRNRNDNSSRSGVRNSGNSRNRNDNSNSVRNRNGQKQGQLQGQLQGQGQQQGISKSGNSQNNINIGNVGGGGYGDGGYGQGGSRSFSPDANARSRSNQHQSLDGNNSGAANDTYVDAADNSQNSVYYEGDEAQKRNPVSTAWAAPLIATEDTCMGSTSAGGQGITLGFSFASTWRDRDCVIRKDARFLHNAQHQTVALGLMCDKERVRKAVAIAGSPAERLACGLNEDGSEPSGKAAASAPVATSASSTVVPASTFDWGDED